MAKLKMLKLPKKPKLGKKPAQSASFATKQSWLRRQADKKLKYEARLRAVQHENAKRKVINDASQKASTVIAGIGDIMEVRPSAFNVKQVRAHRSTAHVTGVKRRKKSATKKRTTGKSFKTHKWVKGRGWVKKRK